MPVQQTYSAMKTKLSDLVKYEEGVERNAARAIKSLTIDDIDWEIGTCFNIADGTVVVAADVATLTGVWILIDDSIYTDVTATGAHNLGVLTGHEGVYVEVAREQLKFGDALSSGQIDSVEAILKAQGIKVVNQY